MSYTVTRENFESLTSYWKNSNSGLRWDSVFVLPVWLEVWWREFQPGTELYLTAIRQEADIIGIAPLQVSAKTAAFVGNSDVCDYLDFVTAPGKESDFFAALFDNLKQKGINRLELKHVRPDSTVVAKLAEWARNTGYEVSCHPDEVSFEMDLPPAWEDYLRRLTAKQRHEVGRKLRRLGEMGKVNYRSIEDGTAAEGAMDTFVKLFTESRRDKAAFMTARMESFFRAMARAMTDAGLLRLGILELDSLPTAMVMCFDYNNTIHLYNSGYDPQYGYLSAGLLSKIMCIKDSIERGKQRFDFLKGAESYKYELGGKEIPLYGCEISLK